MPSKSTPTKATRRSDVSPRKQISKLVTSAKLWTADEKVFHEFVSRRSTTPAILLREIVHDWAVSMRVSGKTTDTTPNAGPIRKLHEQILSEQLTPVTNILTTILELLNGSNPTRLSLDSDTSIVPSTNQDSALLTILQRLAEELQTTQQELTQLKAFAAAHYMLSGQHFSATWATLDFILRYVAEPLLRKDPDHAKDSFQASLIHRDDARKEGLQMVEQMSLAFHYPQEYKLVLVNPSED
jgi:hypothetical protein